MSKKKARNRNRKVRMWLEQNCICWLCDQTMGLFEATRDHLIPISKGGSDSWKNIRLAHALCNRLRGDTPADLARAHVQSLLRRRSKVGQRCRHRHVRATT